MKMKDARCGHPFLGFGGWATNDNPHIEKVAPLHRIAPQTLVHTLRKQQHIQFPSSTEKIRTNDHSPDFPLYFYSQVFPQSSIVDKSPVGRSSSHAFRTRRMIFPLRVLGSLSRNSISRGAACAARPFLTKLRISSLSSSVAS